MKSRLHQLLIMVAIMLGMAISSNAFAQQGPPPAGGGEGQAPAGQQQQGNSTLDEMTEALGLTADQQAKVKVLLEEREASIGKTRESFPEWNDEAKAALDKMMDEEAEKVRSVLTKEQLPKYEAYLEEVAIKRAQEQH